MATKIEERKALNQIKEIIQKLGDDSYIASAFEGCFEIAESNIDNDFADSMQDRLAAAKIENEKLTAKLRAEAAAVEELKAENARLTRELEKEQEWKDYIPTNVSQDDYDKLRQDGCSQLLTDKEAVALINEEFGFDRARIKILHSAPAYQQNRHGRLRVSGEIARDPIYNATDWNYVRFACGWYTYEMYDGNLQII